jgi:hypothetical protein
MLLTRTDLESLTGYVRPSAQRRWLDARGWVYEIGADGRPKVLRSYVEQMMGGQTERTKRRPRLHLPHVQTSHT